jgi:hypothetical protein
MIRQPGLPPVGQSDVDGSGPGGDHLLGPRAEIAQISQRVDGPGSVEERDVGGRSASASGRRPWAGISSARACCRCSSSPLPTPPDRRWPAERLRAPILLTAAQAPLWALRGGVQRTTDDVTALAEPVTPGGRGAGRPREAGGGTVLGDMESVAGSLRRMPPRRPRPRPVNPARRRNGSRPV